MSSVNEMLRAVPTRRLLYRNNKFLLLFASKLSRFFKHDAISIVDYVFQLLESHVESTEICKAACNSRLSTQLGREDFA